MTTARFPLPNPGQIRICSLEEIEQNMIKQQQQQQQQEQIRRGMTPIPRPPPGFSQPGSNHSQHMGGPPTQLPYRPIPGSLGFPSPALLAGNGHVPPGAPLRPLFPPTNMPPPPGPGQGGHPNHTFPFPINFQGQLSMPPPSTATPTVLPPNNNNNNNSNNNASFSQRLVEEIQQNHPMLPHYRQQPPPATIAQPPLPLGGPPPNQLTPLPPHGNFKHPFLAHHPPFPPNWNQPHNPQHLQHLNSHPHHQQQGHHGHHSQHHQHQQPGHHPFMQQHHPLQHHHMQHLQQHPHHNQQQAGGGHRMQNGKMNWHGGYDEYANMMSERAKHWLLGIQLSQLNKETAYYNDYYFCVFRDRKERERGAERESKAHKDNTFYHPFSQQMLHRNGLIRERRNSDNKMSGTGKENIKEIQPRNYKPVQFENSLGRLQCASVIAPRKIIDQDVVVDRSVADGNNGAAGGGNNSETVHHQRRSRQILLHVENLYRLVLRLEDMVNPLAIEAKQQMKEKRAKERLLGQEKGGAMANNTGAATDEQNNVANNGGAGSTTAPAVSVTEVEQDTFTNLLGRILPALNVEGVLRLMSVRKGKMLLKRIQKSLSAHPARWVVWCTVLSTLVALPKRDRDDSDDQLSPLFAQLELHVKYASATELMPLFETLLNTDQLLTLVPKCKFLLLTVLTLIAQMEQLITIGGGALKNGDNDENDDDRGKLPVVMEHWMTLLRELVRVIVEAPPQKVLLKLDSSCGIVKLLRAHLQRYPELDLERKIQAVVSLVDAGIPSDATERSPESTKQ